jgi:cell wall-associated NlpC family hydrolase
LLFPNRSSKTTLIPAAGGTAKEIVSMKLRPVRIVTVLMFGVALALLFPGYAPAQPTNDIRARAAKLEKDLQASNAKVAALGEELAATEAKVAEAEARLKPIQDEINRIKSMINGRAASFYKFAGAAGPLDALNAQDESELSARSKYGDVAAGNDDNLVQQLAAQRAELDKVRAQVAAQRDALAAAKADADAAAADQQKLLDQVKGEIEAELRRQTADRAAPSQGGPAPLGSGGAGVAAAFARDQVGKAYCNTADRFGPSCYDCSGLTYMSWRAGGLEIPKVSGAQGSAYPRVPLSSLQPGDLVTSSSWGAHVGIWVGDGFVHATNYGNNPNAVLFVAGTGRVVDAVRPS